MTNKREYGSRWFDQEDFTPSHDMIMTWLMSRWYELIPEVYGESPFQKAAKGSLTAEPVLDGYPPIFPDAIACGIFVFGNPDSPPDDRDERACQAYYVGPEFRVLFEIKPTIDSLGSVLRQLQLYSVRARIPANHIVLISPDHRFDAQFRQQGFHVPFDAFPDSFWENVEQQARQQTGPFDLAYRKLQSRKA